MISILHGRGDAEGCVGVGAAYEVVAVDGLSLGLARHGLARLGCNSAQLGSARPGSAGLVSAQFISAGPAILHVLASQAASPKSFPFITPPCKVPNGFGVRPYIHTHQANNSCVCRAIVVLD